MYYLGAMRVRDGDKRLRVLHPASWIVLPVLFPLTVLFVGLANFPELLEDIKDQLCWW